MIVALLSLALGAPVVASSEGLAGPQGTIVVALRGLNLWPEHRVMVSAVRARRGGFAVAKILSLLTRARARG